MPPESISNQRKRMAEIIICLKREYPDSRCSLIYESPFQLLVSTILSAQCTDERVNKVAHKLFTKYPSAKDFEKLQLDTIKKAIYSTGFYNNKAKSIKNMAKAVIEDHGGQLPDNLENMVKLPGVGRKTANVVGSVYFDIPAMPVDTHVFRVADRIGLTTKAKTPLAAELQLLKLFPKDKLNIAHHWLILHGRYLCKARRPECERCEITTFCRYYSKM